MLANKILPIIRKQVLQYGSDFTLIKKGAMEEIDGDLVSTGDVSITFKGVDENYFVKDENGTYQVAGIKITAIFENEQQTITTDDEVLFQNTKYSIFDSQPIIFQNVLMGYIIYGRK